MALDLEAGRLLVSVDGDEWTVAHFSEPCAPGAGAGAALFPALSGAKLNGPFRASKVRCNWGADERRPMRHAPPSGDYQAVGLLPQKVPLTPELPFFSLFYLHLPLCCPPPAGIGVPCKIREKNSSSKLISRMSEAYLAH